MAKVVLKTSANLPRRVSAKRYCFRRRLRPCDKRDVQEERRKQLHGHAVGSALTGICFDPVCTEAQNQIAALAIGFPIFFALLILRVAWQKTEVSSRGVEVKKEEEEQEYQLDAQGDYVFGLSGFRLFRVPATTTSANGGTQFIKVEVGPVQSPKKAKTFFFEKSQSFRSSEIFSCSLEHPIGVTFERTRAGKVVIAEIAEGTDAYRQNQVARLNQGTKKAPKVGVGVGVDETIQVRALVSPTMTG